MRSVFRALLVLVSALGAAAGTRAQPPAEVKYSSTNVFTFAPAPSELTQVPAEDVKKLEAKAEMKLRPNASTELYAWVLNPTEEKEFVVEVRGPKGTFTAQTEVTIPRDKWVRVRLPKLAPAAPAVPPAAPAPAADPKLPPAPETPPGVQLPVTRGEIRLTFLLLDKNKKPLTDNDGRPYGGSYPVEVLAPVNYVKTPVGTVTPKETLGVRMTVTPEPDFLAPGTGPVQLAIPPQDALAGATIRDGIYRRLLTFGPKGAPVTLTGTLEGVREREKVRVYVGVDGIDRAFVFTVNPQGKTPETQLLPDRRPAVRVVPLRELVTQPVARFPVRLEVDNPSADDTLELRLRPSGAKPDVTEVVKLSGTREVRVWFDPAGPTDGGLVFSTRSNDWVTPLDLSQFRGKMDLTAVLGTADRVFYSEPVTVTVDATPPEKIEFLRFPESLERGKPLPVAATVSEPDSEVSKATFYLFRQLEDGKIPASAVKAEGVRSTQEPAVWTADLKVPDDFRGPGMVAVVFANAVGLVSEPKVQKIEIVEPKPKGAATGTIAGKVVFGDRPQPGVPVSLRDADNKEKAAGTTDDTGKFKFENVPPGLYTLVAAKKDSSTGASGTAPVQVEAEKTAKPVVTLAKNRG